MTHDPDDLDHAPSCSHGDTPTIDVVIEGRARDIGGFPVRRTLPSGLRRAVGPFIFLDHMGPVELAPGHGMDVRPHPHIGLATLTYLLDGEIVHRDSLGSTQPIRPGDVIDGELACDGRTFTAATLLVLRPHVPAAICARTAANVMLVGGAPLDGPRHIWWNFVSSDRDRIERAKADWRAGRFAKVIGDEHEFVPLPEP